MFYPVYLVIFPSDFVTLLWERVTIATRSHKQGIKSLSAADTSYRQRSEGLPPTLPLIVTHFCLWRYGLDSNIKLNRVLSLHTVTVLSFEIRGTRFKYQTKLHFVYFLMDRTFFYLSRYVGLDSNIKPNCILCWLIDWLIGCFKST